MLQLSGVDDEATRLLFAKVKLAREGKVSSSVLVVALPVRRTLKLLTAIASLSRTVISECTMITTDCRDRNLPHQGQYVI